MIPRRILVLIIQISFCTICFAQREKIDSLKKILPGLKDIARINCLNSLSKEYLYKQSDTSSLYSGRAYQEAARLAYVQGMADAMFNKGKNENEPVLKEQDFLSAISLYQQCNNVDTLGQVYFQLGRLLTTKVNFTAAIAAYKKAEQLYIQANDPINRGVTLTFIGLTYETSGDYEKAFEYGYQALQVREKNNEHTGVLWSLCNLAQLFLNVEDYPMAIDYYRNQTLSYAGAHEMTWTPYYDKISEAYSGMHQYDSALYYMEKYAIQESKDSTGYRKKLDDPEDDDYIIGEIHLIKKEYDKALRTFFNKIKKPEWQNNGAILMGLYGSISDAYAGKGDYTNALIYAKKLLNLAQSTGARQYIRDGVKQAWMGYDHLQIPDSAYKYYRQYIDMRDSVNNYRFLSQMVSFKETAAKERRELQYTQELQKQSFIRKILIGSILLFAFLATIILRNVSLKRKNERLEKERLKNELNVQQLESEKKQTELQNKTIEMEMQALRAQMNPHFIFNSLNSINRFILQNNRQQASEYLTKFSKLVRMILQNSQSPLINLESELESLGLYLEMEALRFNYHFEYKISVSRDLDVEMLKVPPLIIQPYVENAIWHGLMHKEEKGQLNIDVSQEDEYLYIRVTDNGIGRKRASEIAGKSATKHKSMGLRITALRIAMLQHSNGEGSPVKINDLVTPDGIAAGTEVVIKMPVIEGDSTT